MGLDRATGGHRFTPIIKEVPDERQIVRDELPSFGIPVPVAPRRAHNAPGILRRELADLAIDVVRCYSVGAHSLLLLGRAPAVAAARGRFSYFSVRGSSSTPA